MVRSLLSKSGCSDVRIPFETHRLPLIFAIGCLLARFAVTIAAGPAFADDSTRYVSARQFVLDIDLWGIDGQASPLVQTVWTLPANLALVVQALVSGFAWLMLAVVGLRRLGRSPWAMAYSVVLMVLAGWPVVWAYDTFALTESMSISGSVLCVAGAFGILFSQSPAACPDRFWTVFLCGYLIAMTARPVNAVLLLPLCLVVLISRRRQDKRATVTAGSLLVIGVTLYGGVLLFNASHSDMETFRAVNRLAWRSSDAYVKAAEKNGLGFCDESQRQQLLENYEGAYEYRTAGLLTFRRLGGERQPQVAFAREYLRALPCPAVQDWLGSGQSSALRIALADPLEMLRQYGLDLASVLRTSAPRYSLGLPSEAGRLFYPLANLSLLVLLSGRVVRTLCRKTGGRDTPLAPVVALGVLLLSALAHSFATWAVDAMEVGRHFLPTPAVLGPALLLGLIGLAGGKSQ